jgi:hypothetical protein
MLMALPYHFMPCKIKSRAQDKAQKRDEAGKCLSEVSVIAIFLFCQIFFSPYQKISHFP